MIQCLLPPPPSSFSLYPAYLIFFFSVVVLFFGFLGPRTRTQLSWVDAKCEEDFLAIFTATAQMNDHYADLKWKLSLKWICNELSRNGRNGTEGCGKKSESRRPTQCIAVSCDYAPKPLRPTVIASPKDMLQLNKKKITLKRCGVSTTTAQKERRVEERASG